MATIRFSELVKTSGRPGVATLWVEPKKDAPFMKAAAQNRVLTVLEEPQKAPYGQIGFHQGSHASYFIFPKRLPGKPGAKVIGIKYDLLDQPKAAHHRTPPKLTVVESARPSGEKPKRIYRVHIRRTAVVTSTLPVAARNPAEAKKNALAIMKEEPPDLSHAVFHDQVTVAK